MKCPYDPLAPATLRDPFPAYAQLRDRCPVHLYSDFTPPFFTLSRYEDVVEGLRDSDTWSIRFGDNPHFMSPAGLFNDPPIHSGFRGLFNKAFTPRAVAKMSGTIETIAGQLIDEMVASGPQVDFVDQFASKLPLKVIAGMLGIPSADLPIFRGMCDELVATYNDPDPAASSGPRKRLDTYFQGLVDERRQALLRAGVTEPDGSCLGEVISDDLISALVVAEHEGQRLSDADLHLMLVLLLLGGLETSTALLANMLWRLLDPRDHWEVVQEDRGLIDVAVEESLRFDPPVLGLFRTPTRDVTLHQVSIPQDHKVMLAFASANRDAKAGAERPEEFRLDRPLEEARRHVTFGYGAHFCPGAPLARLEGRIALRLLLDRLPEVRLAGEPTRIAPFILWGRHTLPIDVGAPSVR